MISNSELFLQPAWNSSLGRFLIRFCGEGNPRWQAEFSNLYQFSIFDNRYLQFRFPFLMRCWSVVGRCFATLLAITQAILDLGKWTFRSFTSLDLCRQPVYHLAELISAWVGLVSCLKMPFGYLPKVSRVKYQFGFPLQRMIEYYGDGRAAREIIRRDILKGATFELNMLSYMSSLRRSNANIALCLSAHHGHCNSLKILVKEGKIPVDLVNKIGQTALKEAIQCIWLERHHNLSVIKTLLELNANPLATFEFSCKSGNFQFYPLCTPMQSAIAHNLLPVVKLLRSHIVFPNFEECDGVSLLATTILKSIGETFSIEMAEFLVKSGSTLYDADLRELEVIVSAFESNDYATVDQLIVSNNLRPSDQRNSFICALSLSAQDVTPRPDTRTITEVMAAGPNNVTDTFRAARALLNAKQRLLQAREFAVKRKADALHEFFQIVVTKTQASKTKNPVPFPGKAELVLAQFLA